MDYRSHSAEISALLKASGLAHGLRRNSINIPYRKPAKKGGIA